MFIISNLFVHSYIHILTFMKENLKTLYNPLYFQNIFTPIMLLMFPYRGEKRILFPVRIKGKIGTE